MIIVITGSPRSGKTTLATKLGKQLKLPVISTDDYLNLSHAEQPVAIHNDVVRKGNCIIEGCTAARMLREGKGYYLDPEVVLFCRNDYADIKIWNLKWAVDYTEQYWEQHPDKVLELHLLEESNGKACDQGTIF